jgi:predicted flap endonuclease-1-like 5' DNA nuclease
MSGFSAFLWQAALLLLGAYFIGAWIGCLLRRSMSGPPKVAMESGNVSQKSMTGDTMTGATAALAVGAATAGLAHRDAASERFGRALDGGEPVSSHPTGIAPPPPKPVDSLAQLQRKLTDTAASTDTRDEARLTAASEPAVPQLASEGRAEIPIVEPATNISPSGKTAPFTPPMTAAATAAAALAARQRSNTSAVDQGDTKETAFDTTSEKQLDTADTPPPLAPPEPAAQTSSVVSRMEHLSAAADTQTQAVSETAPDLPASNGSDEQAVVTASIVGSPSIETADKHDTLTLIEGVSTADAEALAGAGVTRFGAIADWSASDVQRMTGVINGDRRIARENWIEQAQLLRNGGLTAFARRAQPSLTSLPEILTAAAATAVLKVDIETPNSAPNVSERAAFSQQRNTYRDDLQQIDGINAEIERLLNNQGVGRITQIADWSPSEATQIDRLLGGMNRVDRETWISQARKLSGYADETPDHEGDDTSAHSTASTALAASALSVVVSDGVGADNVSVDDVRRATDSAPAPQTLFDATDDSTDKASGSDDNHNVVALDRDARSSRSMRGLRSVQSEALIGSQGDIEGEQGDDLKRIRGVGVLIEKRLRSMGCVSYQQIESWTRSDVDRVNQELDYRGQIERENWIEQARILAAGGQTDFSRRSDRRDD